MIGEFQSSFPDIRADQTYGNVSELQTAIRTNQLDLAICPMAQMQADDGFEFIEVLPGRNVIACHVGHPLLRRRCHNPKDLQQLPGIMPLPGSPLPADLHTILLSISVSEIAIRYWGGSLLSVLNYLEETDALTDLPHSLIFAFRHSGKVRVLPVHIPQPARSLGIIHMKGGPSFPAAAKLLDHIHTKFKDLRHLILRQENSVAWGGWQAVPALLR